MSVVVSRVAIATDGAGAFERSISLHGVIRAIRFVLGTLSTPAILVTDDATAVEILNVAGLAADDYWQLGVQLQGSDGEDVVGAFASPTVVGPVVVTVAGGGANKAGTLYLVTER